MKFALFGLAFLSAWQIVVMADLYVKFRQIEKLGNEIIELQKRIRKLERV